MTDVDNPPKNFTNATYIRSPLDSDLIDSIRVDINGVMSYIPIPAEDNPDYAELMRQVEAGYVIIESS